MPKELKQIDLTKFMNRCWQTHFKKQKAGFVALSPFREEKTPSLYVSRKEDGHWVYFDHGSGNGGTIIDAVMEYEGHKDIGQAIRTAKRMAQDAGLLSKDIEPPSGPEKQLDLEGLFKKLCTNETGLVREYLIGRCISPELVKQMISSHGVVLNRYHESNYCCFAIRDAQGVLRSLYNRKIDGPAGEKFLLGQQYPFCLDWKKSAQAAKIHLCEGVIDALSLLTLEKNACVLGFPGANYDPKNHDCLPAKGILVEAFDKDEAGRKAAKRLRQTFKERTVESFDMGEARDVNELLCSKSKPSGKLSVDDKVAMALSNKASRDLGKEYQVHHSRVCNVRKEANAILTEAWGQRQVGRKPKPKPSEDVERLVKELAEMKRLSELKTMRNEWLELKVKMTEERVEEAARKSKARKKKAS